MPFIALRWRHLAEDNFHTVYIMSIIGGIANMYNFYHYSIQLLDF